MAQQTFHRFTLSVLALLDVSRKKAARASDNVSTVYDIALTTTTPPANCNQVTDEAGKVRKSCVDGAGRLTYVFEDPSGLNFETDYTYDPLDNLLSVTQKGGTTTQSQWRTRTFHYDSLSRLTNAVNPESGSITYGYDANSNLTTRIAPSPNQAPAGNTVTTTYTYDTLNRLTGKSYVDTYTQNPATPAVTYAYDGNDISTCPIPIGYHGHTYDVNVIGRRSAMCYAGGNASWHYDPMGRIVTESDRYSYLVPPYANTVYFLNGVPYTSTYTWYGYYLNGDLGQTFYPGPNGPQPYEFYTQENAAGQVIKAGDVNQVTLSGGILTPTGQLATAMVGANSNAISISNTYNNRMQPVLISANTPGGASILNLTYNFNLGTTDNGNVIQIANGKDSNRTQNFLYDSLNRIQQAYTNGPNWGETYSPTATAPGVPPTTPGIDAWGNLTNRSGVTGKTNSENRLNCPASTSNQLSTCFTYDAVGNVIQNGSITYTYDAENRLIATAGISYIYDGDGNRIEKCTEGTNGQGQLMPGTCASNATGTIYWNHQDGGVITESDLHGNWTAVYGLIRGQLVSRVDIPGNVVHYYFHDHLSSTNVVTDAVGNIQNESDYYPYGGEIVVSSGDSNRYKFTGQERDTESGLDHLGARQYNSAIGRFMVPDPSDVDSVEPLNPQSWNLYAYGMNNPLKFLDPSGLWCYYGTTDDNGQPDYSNPDATDNINYDFNTNKTECEGTGENPNGGTWYDDWRDTITINGGSTPPIDTIGVSTLNMVPATIGVDSGGCYAKSFQAVGKELIGFDIANYLSGKVDDWAMAHSEYPVVSPNAPNPFGSSTAGTSAPPSPAAVGVMAFTTHVLKEGAEAIHGNPGAEQAIRQGLRYGGWKVSTKAVGKLASKGGKYLGLAGAGLAAYTFVGTLRNCMGD